MKKTVCMILFTGLLCFLVVLPGCSRQSYFQTKSSREENGKTKLSLGSKSKKTAPAGEASDKIYVQVAGAVASPGVYELDRDSRVFQAIRAAGGLTKKAYDRDLNQAGVLSDGQKIYVLSRKEAKETGKVEETESGGGQSSGKATEGSAELVNINQADKNALVTLPGIGDTRAEAILAYRKEHGPFQDPKDITLVSGIGSYTYEKLKDKIII